MSPNNNKQAAKRKSSRGQARTSSAKKSVSSFQPKRRFVKPSVKNSSSTQKKKVSKPSQSVNRKAKRQAGSRKTPRTSRNTNPSKAQSSSLLRPSLSANKLKDSQNLSTKSNSERLSRSKQPKTPRNQRMSKSGTTASEIGAQRVADNIWSKPSSKKNGRSGSSVHLGTRVSLHGTLSSSLSTGSSPTKGIPTPGTQTYSFDPTMKSNGTARESGILSWIGRAFRALGRGFLFIFHKSRAAAFVIVVALVLCCVGGIDTLVNNNKIYQGVSVGTIDLSGKTQEEAAELIAQEYVPRINNNSITFYASQEAMDQESSVEQNETLEEQLSYEESLSNRNEWTTNAQILEASFDPYQFAHEAYEVGRSDGGLFGRINALTSGLDIQPTCTFNETNLNEFRDALISALGTKMNNYSVVIEDAQAKVNPGNDGEEVQLQWLTEQLNSAFFSSETKTNVVALVEFTPMQIDQEKADRAASVINNSVAQGINFQFEENSWLTPKDTVINWVSTRIEGSGDTSVLVPYFDPQKATPEMLTGTYSNFVNNDFVIHFIKDGDQIMVQNNAGGAIPAVAETLQEMDSGFFVNNPRQTAPTYEIGTTELAGEVPFDEALNYGLITDISSFTTQYASGATARNHNIHTAADFLNNSICPAGGTWSFNDINGETTEERGYENAGAIISGEYSDAIGGGVCQVATTVFNAVYNSGFPIVERHNHSLYIASYPEGRDAAIAYPDLDLVWSNDTNSDVLLVMSYTNSSVTATLYGVDPSYEVSTEYGEWTKGQPYKTTVRDDPTYPAGTTFTESSGTDGRSITIVRTVKDKDGNILHSEEISSNYNPKNKIIVEGTG